MLKAQKVSELPYIKGMLKKVNMSDYDDQLQKEYKINKVVSANSGVLTKEKAQRVVKVLDEGTRQRGRFLLSDFFRVEEPSPLSVC